MNTNFLTTIATSAVTSAVVGITAAGFVNLQDATPGTPQTGHINVTGTVRATSLGLGAAPGTNRAQVTATGTTGGLRVDTNIGAGLSVFTNGVSGQFITRGTTAPNNRAMVGDAQASNGVTFGGVFVTRTADAGAGAYAQAIGANNTGTGLIAENTAATGKALVARNTGNNNTLEAGTAGDSLITNGAIPRHSYVANTPAAMVPIAYGQVDSFGEVESGSGNITSTRASKGVYQIDVTGFGPNAIDATIVVTCQNFGGFQGATYDTSSGGGDFDVRTFDLAGDLVDTDFSFIVFMPVPSASPAMPEELKNPPGLRRFKGDDEAWAKADPRGHREWLSRYRAWQTQAAALPTAP